MQTICVPADATFLPEVIDKFPFPEKVTKAERYGMGHINRTYCVTCMTEQGESLRYILQGLSQAAFPRPKELMENFVKITSYLRKQIAAAGGDPDREALSVVPAKDGKSYYEDEEGCVWRLVPFIENTVCMESATPELFEASAKAFGHFQYMLRDFPAGELHETIEKFHDTEDRLAKFEAAVSADKVGRVAEAEKEIRFIRQRKADCSVALDAFRRGILPLRVTHNDTKLNNILIDKDTGEGICVIDLDTTMPGLSINDFGDSIRFGANHCAEDEKDLHKVNFDLELFRVYTRGFLEGAQGGLTHEEIRFLPWGARLMTLECGIRFLTDYLEGDHYFAIDYPEQNLDRSRTQFKLVKDMEDCFDVMEKTVLEIAEQTRG